ncbi:hypothetical protein CRG98_018499 [Punica granatum]|uniref:Uncharacterized protein n=1 Tax=Punica granatum TaxID=22663 RepID=A0A2I0JXQ2_PUNGR|nr:hypothetical protein CRG98_018499 [Punica granatum]
MTDDCRFAPTLQVALSISGASLSALVWFVAACADGPPECCIKGGAWLRARKSLDGSPPESAVAVCNGSRE